MDRLEHDAVIEAARRRSVALVAGDATALGALLTDDFAYVNSAGHVLDRASYLRAYVTSGETRWIKQEIDDFHVRIEGDVAVLICRVRDVASFEGEAPTDTRARATQVWRKAADGWRCLSIQTTRLDA